MEYLETNVFDVANPEIYRCKVCCYFKQHSYLVVKAYPASEPGAEVLYFSFAAVHYFAGPISWIGADFRLATTDERKRLLKKLSHLKYFTYLDPESITLFIVEQAGFQVKILADSGGQSKNQSDLEKWPWSTLSLEEVKGINYDDEIILKIPNPQAYFCEVLFYHQLTSVLVVGLRRKVETKNEYIFWFTGVEYFDGPLGWRGANFNRTSSIIHKGWLQRLKSNETIGPKLLYLYEEVSGSKVKIVAQKATNYIPNT